jgi:flagellar biosynthetic protein FliP
VKTIIAMAALAARPGLAAASDSLLGVTLVQDKTGHALSVPMQILLLFTAMTLLPAILMALTPFLRITIVLHFLRQALGTQTAPSNPVLVALALFLALIIVQPVAVQVYHQGWEPLENGQVSASQAWDQASGPIKTFLLKFAREKDIQLFIELGHSPAPAKPSDVPISALAPAYVLSELKAAFQIGAVLFLPFLIIDLVVASVTLSLGMVQLPPAMISAPFKILLFVLVDGWNLVVGSLVRSFY